MQHKAERRDTAEILGLRAYARRRGCTPTVVHDAIKSGRIAGAVVERKANGRVMIDVARADQLWQELTRPKSDAHMNGANGHANGDAGATTFAMSRARREEITVQLSEITLAKQRGELVSAKDVEHRIAEVFAQCRTKILGVPARARQQDPALTVAQVTLFETLIRETLEALSSGDIKP